MAHGPFIITAYVISGVTLAWLLVSSWMAMRKAEALADDLRERV